MKKNFLINSEISAVIASLGHTDTIVIGDCGLPIPANVKRIDLSIKRGLPSFSDVLDAVLTEMAVESFTIAGEASSAFEELCFTSFTNAQDHSPELHKVSHEQFKKISANAKAVIRTGEASPYYNIILSSGVVF